MLFINYEKEEIRCFMRFCEYYKIMKEHGIGELFFLYNDIEGSISTENFDFTINYSISFDGNFYNSDNLDEIVFSKYLFNGKTLEDVWDELEILSIDGVSLNDYDCKTCSYDYVERLKQNGELQWSYYHSTKKSFLMTLRYIILGAVVLPVLSVLIPLFKLGNWNVVLFVSFFAIVALFIGVVATLLNGISINYQITTKKIFFFTGVRFETKYDNIKKVKLKKSFFKKGYGTIKLYLKKGISLNYRIEYVPDIEEVYNLIMKNLKENTVSYNFTTISNLP